MRELSTVECDSVSGGFEHRYSEAAAWVLGLQRIDGLRHSISAHQRHVSAAPGLTITLSFEIGLPRPTALQRFIRWR